MAALGAQRERDQRHDQPLHRSWPREIRVATDRNEPLAHSRASRAQAARKSRRPDPLSSVEELGQERAHAWCDRSLGSCRCRGVRVRGPSRRACSPAAARRLAAAGAPPGATVAGWRPCRVQASPWLRRAALGVSASRRSAARGSSASRWWAPAASAWRRRPGLRRGVRSGRGACGAASGCGAALATEGGARPPEGRTARPEALGATGRRRGPSVARRCWEPLAPSSSILLAAGTLVQRRPGCGDCQRTMRNLTFLGVE